MRVSFIQKECSPSSSKMKSMPLPSASSLRNMSPRSRFSGVSASSTWTTCVFPPDSRMAFGPPEAAQAGDVASARAARSEAAPWRAISVIQEVESRCMAADG